MFKRILTLLTLFAVLLTFIGCGSNSSTTATEDTASKEESNSTSHSTPDNAPDADNSYTDEDNSSDFSEDISEDISDVTDEPVVEIIPQDSVVSFYGCGDNMAHNSQFFDGIENAAAANGVEPDYSDLNNAEYDFSPYYEYIKDDIAAADISYINQETLIGGDSRPISSYPKFNSPKEFGQNVIDLGFDVVNLAHNHMFDSRDTTFVTYSHEFFSQQGVTTLGYYPNEESVNNIPIIEKNGIKIAFLTYTYGTNGLKPESDSSFVMPLFEKELIEKQVLLAKQQADFIIVSAHWGHEYTYKPNSMQKEYAEFLTNLEVDVVLGMHSHCIQPIEWQYSESGHKTLIIYSLGSMVSGIRKGMSALSGIVTFDIVKDGETGAISLENVLYRPAILHYIRGRRGVNENDTGSRFFKVYYLEDYTEELADAHVIGSIERRDGTQTLIGGGFSLENLYKTVFEVIDEEFLPQAILDYKAE